MDWSKFLATHGGQLVDGHAAFDLPEAWATLTTGAVCVPLTAFGCIRFSGEDTLAFLQGQLSSDVKQLPDTGSQYSSYSTPKGRMLASFLLLREGSDVCLLLPRALLPATLKRLQMYVLRSKTQPTDFTHSLAPIGLCGPATLTMAGQVFDALPDTEHLSRETPWGRLLRLPGERLLLLARPEALEAAWQALRGAGFMAAGEASWTLSDIRAGIPWILPQTVEAFVPQMANMELIGAVSFRKGCYPGQEIVARTQYLGKLKRRAVRMLSPVAAQPGDEVFSPEMAGQASGQVALAAPAGNGQWELLVVAQLSSLPYGLHLGTVDGPVLKELTLPYAFPTTES
jgi:hypothetical protein